MNDLQDIDINDCGSIVLLTPRTEAAREWLEAHTSGMWVGCSLAVEPRYVADLLEAEEAAV